MNLLLILLALTAIPLIFLTMYSKISEGMKIRLGSFFIIRKFKSDFLRVRTFKDIISLILRLCCAGLIIILIYDPSEVNVSPGKLILHEPESDNKVKNIYNFKLIAPNRAIDSFDEDLFFLESFLKHKKFSLENIIIIYNPEERTINNIDNADKNMIVFPGKKQAGSAFLKWIELIDISALRSFDSKIKDTAISIKNCYPILIKNTSLVKKYTELEDGSAIAVSFTDGNRKVLIFGAGVSGFWGDMGVSGYFMDIIDSFISSLSLSGQSEKKLQRSDHPETSQVRSLLPFDIILYIACIIFIIESIVFIIRSIRFKKLLIIIILFLFSSGLYSEDFKFIELDLNENTTDNSRIFFILKRELQDKTSIRISQDFYSVISPEQLINGKLPDLPYLWITGCKQSRAISPKLANALQRFIEKGGIVFAELHGDTGCLSFFRELGRKISSSGLIQLPQDHPIYKSYYLISSLKFSGADISVTTRRTALIICEDNLFQKIHVQDESSLKTGVNIVLYMLSGNYKSDQVHTRQILNRLKKRELFR
jgi:hypothetical protein